MYVVLFWPLFSPGGRGKPWFKHDYSHHDTEINRRAWNLVQSLSWHFSGGKFPLHFPPTLKASPVTPTACQSQQQNSYPAAGLSPTDWLRCAHTQVLLMHSWAVFLCPHLQMSVPQRFWDWLTPTWPLTHKFWPAHDPAHDLNWSNSPQPALFQTLAVGRSDVSRNKAQLLLIDKEASGYPLT